MLAQCLDGVAIDEDAFRLLELPAGPEKIPVLAAVTQPVFALSQQ